jgi:hypothetical protein
MSDLWHEAGADHDFEAREASLARADAEMLPILSFLFESRTPRELEHRLAFAATRIERVSDVSGVPVDELEESARRRYALLKEALPEGTDPVTPVLQAGQSFGSGPAEGYEHDEGPDFSHGYSEIPQGAPGGPDPQVVSPENLKQPNQPVQEATASLCRCGSLLTKKGKCRTCRSKIANCMCHSAAVRTTDTTSGSPPSGAPMSGAPGSSAGAASGGMGAAGNLDVTPAQSVTASRDPVALQVTAIAHSVQASNPMLTESECRRVARRVVGGYLQRQGDLASGVMSDQPWAPGPGGSGDGSSGASDGSSGGSMLQHGLEWQGLKSMTRGSGGGGAAAEGGSLLGEAAELAAL